MLQGWGSLTMAFTGKFVYIYIYMHHYVYIVYVYIYIYVCIYIYINILYIKIKTEQFCISFEICCFILNLFLLTYEHIYNVTYNRYVLLTIGSVIRVYYRVV